MALYPCLLSAQLFLNKVPRATSTDYFDRLPVRTFLSLVSIYIPHEANAKSFLFLSINVLHFNNYTCVICLYHGPNEQVFLMFVKTLII